MEMFYGVLIGLACAYFISNIVVIIWEINGEQDSIVADFLCYTSLMYLVSAVVRFIGNAKKLMYKKLYKDSNRLVYDWSTNLASQMTKEEFEKHSNEEKHNLRLNIGYTSYGEKIYPFRNLTKSKKYWKRMAFYTEDFKYCPKRILKQFDYYKGL